MRKYTYMGNDSSYSVAKEDDVDIIFLDTLSSDVEKENTAAIHETSDASNISSSLESDQSTLRSFTFETQVWWCLESVLMFWYDLMSFIYNGDLHVVESVHKMPLNFKYMSVFICLLDFFLLSIFFKNLLAHA